MMAPLCREPWQNYYILRRGVMPCCYGHAPIASMNDWATAWNSAELQEIRSHLASGRLSPYCLLSQSCPIVQRHYAQHPEAVPPAAPVAGASVNGSREEEPAKRPALLRAINMALGGVPRRLYSLLAGRDAGRPSTRR